MEELYNRIVCEILSDYKLGYIKTDEDLCHLLESIYNDKYGWPEINWSGFDAHKFISAVNIMQTIAIRDDKKEKPENTKENDISKNSDKSKENNLSFVPDKLFSMDARIDDAFEHIKYEIINIFEEIDDDPGGYRKKWLRSRGFERIYEELASLSWLVHVVHELDKDRL